MKIESHRGIESNGIKNRREADVHTGLITGLKFKIRNKIVNLIKRSK